jgi:hypothetical protein
VSNPRRRTRVEPTGWLARSRGAAAAVAVGLALVVAGCGGPADVEVSAPGGDPSPTPTATAGSTAGAAGAGTNATEPIGTPTATETVPSDGPAAAAADPCASLGPDDDARAFITVTSPVDGDTLPSGGSVTGCGNTFEATFQWEVTDASGTVVGAGFDTMTCGNGCAGTFTATVTYEVAADGPGTLTLFEVSAADGSRQHETSVAVSLVAG